MDNRVAPLLVLPLLFCGQLALTDDPITLFEGKNGSGWLTNESRKPVPKANIQADGLNPHNSGGYIVVHETPRKDFVLDFDYKLSEGCNSGVFLRVGDLADPVMTGIEVALDDTDGAGLHDSGAFYDLVAPKSNAQKPTGEWNHMTITAKGPKISVRLNGTVVSEIDLDQFNKEGMRPDGSKHKFSAVAFKEFNRKGFFGFQDHGQDCWFRDVKLTPTE